MATTSKFVHASRALVSSTLSAASALGVAACAGTDVAADDFSAADTASLGQDLRPAAGAGYVTLRRDVRRCASPLCGGFFVKSVNRLSTRCVDGTAASECYVADLDLSPIGLSPEQEALVNGLPEAFVLNGQLAPQSTVFGTLGRFVADEAWQGHEGVKPSGAFFRANNEGIVCITSPCLSFSAALLNQRLPAFAIAEVDVEGISSDSTDAFAQLNEADGLLLAARPTIVRGPAGRALGLDASEYYIPLLADEPDGQACGSRGLLECPDGRFCAFPAEADCGRADAPGVCAFRPEICITLFDPVCGCDGNTYSNSCSAAAAGVSVEFDGPCAGDDVEAQ
jgi:hypothetical protein